MPSAAKPPPLPRRVIESHDRLKTALRLPEPGETIADKYALVRVIGQGGMGVVYEATHLRLRQRVAIKILRPHVPEYDEVVQRFNREARAAAQLKSIHTARVIDVDALPSGLPYIVLEYLEGRDLNDELAATGPLPVDEAVDILLQVAEAMGEAHRKGVVHRDLKPSNLFVCKMGNRRVMKVLDFGISKVETEGEARITAANVYFGTPYYAAPEQLREACAADARSDVWSLGIILYELVTGRPPFVGSPTQVITKVVVDPVPWPMEFRPGLSRDFVRVMLHALEKAPENRFQSMRELADALAPFGPSQSVAAALGSIPPKRVRLGDLLVNDGLLAPADLERALEVQRTSGTLLGQALLDLGLVTQADLLTALAKQQGIIVTPERPSAVERVRAEREEPTRVPTPTRPRAAASRRRMWLAIAIGLSLGILAAAGLGIALKANAARPPAPVSAPAR